MAVSEDHWHTRYITPIKLKHFGSVQLSLNVLVVLCLPVWCVKGPWLRKGAEIVILIHIALSHTLFLKTIGCSSRWIALVALAQFWVVSFLKVTVCHDIWVLTEGWSFNSAVEEMAESKRSLAKLHLSVAFAGVKAWEQLQLRISLSNTFKNIFLRFLLFFCHKKQNWKIVWELFKINLFVPFPQMQVIAERFGI